VAVGGKHEHTNDWSESEVAEIAREKRLRSRLRKWERNPTALHDEFPPLSTKQDNGDDSSPDIIVIGAPGSPSEIPSMIVDSGRDRGSHFFRSSIIVPKSRSVVDERETRMARRREINELTMRMGVGTVGGFVEDTPAQSVFAEAESDTKERSDSLVPKPLWEVWGNKIEVWSNVRKIADRAIGSVMSSQRSLSPKEKATLSITVVPWTAVHAAWISYHSSIDARKHWLRDVIGRASLSDDLPDSPSSANSRADKVVEKVKNDPDLDQHEARLLSCIVDPRKPSLLVFLFF